MDVNDPMWKTILAEVDGANTDALSDSDFSSLEDVESVGSELPSLDDEESSPEDDDYTDNEHTSDSVSS